MSAIIQVDFFNSYVIRKVRCSSQAQTAGTTATVFMSPGVTPYQDISTGISNRNYYIEEARIRGGFNNTSTDQGARAYLDEPFPLQQKRINTLIYSGVYNSRTGINRTNVFSVGDAITKSIDPVFGSIQKLYAEDTNLIVWQENKIHRALIDKDTIYTTESGTQTQAGAAVIGQFIPYKGEYGISKNPESFAIYNYRKYFSDKSRNSIMRLSNDGLTEISMYGMQDYFRDELATVLDDKQTTSINIPGVELLAGGTNGDLFVNIKDTVNSTKITPGMTIASQNGGYVTNIRVLSAGTVSQVLYSQPFVGGVVSGGVLAFQYKTKGKVIGGWDIHNRNYLISLQKSPNQVSSDEASFETVAFDEKINGWVSFFTFKPNQMFSVLNKFYTVDEHDIYEHYANVENNRGLFYGVRKPSNVTFIFNDQPSIVKNFQTTSYEGSNGWEITSFKSGFTGFDPNPNGTSTYVQDQDRIYEKLGNAIRSYDEGLYTDSVTGQPLRAGFNRKENRYVANLVSNSAVRSGEIIFGNAMSGIKGYFATVTIETDETTQLGGAKELWSAGTKYVVSSY
tara:strand:+ start:6207 stop:7904 length:1698 start_codon:yes stop_codon:yes gene_type:complete